MKLRSIFLVVAVALLLQSAAASADNISDDPGYMDLDFIAIPANASEVQDIDLGAVLLGIAAEAQNNGDSVLAQALAMIHSVRVKAYSLGEGDTAGAEKSVEKVMKKLEKDHWTRLIYVKDEAETVTVSTKSVDGKMVGLMVVAFDPTDEVLFVNVVGELNFGTLFQLAQQFGIDDLDAIMAELPQTAGDAAPVPEPAGD